MTTNFKMRCLHWYHNEFKTTQLFASMVNTVENSPWHREMNVGTHTDMVVSEYISRCSTVWTKPDVMGFITCVFHDVGKPSAEIWKNSEKRGDYKAYHGHELTSSRMWEDFISADKAFAYHLGLNEHDVYGITWMIEHHVPWATKDPKKLLNYALTIKEILTKDGSYAFVNVLLSDTYGRMSDDAPDRQALAEGWVNMFVDLVLNLEDVGVVDDKIVYIPIGPSGCGKSTHFEKLNDVEHYSWDNLRLLWYPADSYAESWEAANNDSNFKNKINSEFVRLVKSGKSIYVDNVNLSKKSRNFFTTEARKRGYKLVAVVFPITVDQLIYQQDYRTDKVINKSVYSNMYAKVQQPSYGEFDKVEVANANP